VKPGFYILLLVLSLGYGCTTTEVLPPIGVLEKVRNAFYEKKDKEFLLYLSKNFQGHMEAHLNEVRTSFSVLPPGALKGLAKKMGVPVSRISRITLEEYIQYRMKNEDTGLGNDYLVFPIEALKPGAVTDSKQTDEIATLTFENGAKLIFVKEQNLWKIEEYIDTEMARNLEVIRK